MLFLGFWIESVSSVRINCVSHYFYELMFIFFVGICCREVGYFVLTTSNMYMTELADSIKHLNFYAVRFSHVSPICEIANVCRGSDLNSGTQRSIVGNSPLISSPYSLLSCYSRLQLCSGCNM